jgi:hypothetical protein
MTALVLSAYVRGWNAELSLAIVGSVPQVVFEVGTAFVEGDSMAESSDNCVGAGQSRDTCDA